MGLSELRALAAESRDGVRQKVWPQPDPAAGADFTITVPSPQFWLPVALTATLTASDTDVSRQPVLTVTDGTTTIGEQPNGATVAASTAVLYSWVRGIALPLSDATGAIAATVLAVPVLPTGWTIGVTTEAIDAGDQWSAIAITVLQITGGQPAQALRREDAILEHWHALGALLG